MTNYARSERLGLAATLRHLGPDAPTLCEGWETLDLAVHLVIRDRYPLAAPGNVAPAIASKVPFLSKRAKSREDELKALPWADLVGMVAEGPSRLSPTSWAPVDKLTNTAEYFVHREDVRRAQEEWVPRNLPDDEQAALAPMADMLQRRNEHKDGYETVEGDPSERLLYYFGRQSVALVKPLKTA